MIRAADCDPLQAHNMVNVKDKYSPNRREVKIGQLGKQKRPAE